MTTNHLQPDWSTHTFTFRSNDPEAPLAISVADAARASLTGLSAPSGDVYRVTNVEVTIFHGNDDTAPSVEAHGYRLSANGTIDRRMGYAHLVSMSDEDEARFVAAALAVLKEVSH